MILAALKNSLKVFMATIALLIFSGLVESNLFLITAVIVFFVLGVGLVVISTIEARPKQPPLGPNGEVPQYFDENSENLSEPQILIEGLITKILDHCSSLNVNSTLMQQEDGLWLVKVDDETGSFDKIINLSLPSTDSVTRENMPQIESKIFDDIDTALRQLNSEKK